jgi:methyl-accepting chemotaxis protein
MRKGIGLGAMLVSGFAIISLAAIGIGAYGIGSMNAINAADRFLYEKATAPMEQLIAMTKGFQRQRIGLRDFMDAPTKDAATAALAEARAQGAIVAKAAGEIDGTLATANGRELLDAFQKARARYDAVFGAIGDAHEKGDQARVAALMAGTGKEAAAAEQDAIDALVRAKIDYARTVAEDNTRKGAETARWMMLLLGAVAVLAVATAMLITRRVTKSVGGEPSEIAAIADEVALGDLSMRFGDAASLTGIQRSLAGMVASLKAKSEAIKRIADGDLTADVELASERDEVGVSIRQMVVSLGELLGQVSGSVDQVAAGSMQVSSASQALSQGAAEQAASIEQISASLVEINGQTSQNSQNALQMNGLAKTALDRAEGGNVSMKELVAAMADINRSSEDIKKVVKAIDDIAFQINLLALNANVEAARAGKYGKGFAVVADEVRSLAVRSADAVKETTRMVEDSIAKVERGNELVRLTAARLEEIADGSEKVAALADEVANASAEQSNGLEQISAGISQIDQVTQGTSSSSEESAAAAEELAAQAQQLKRMVERFKLRQEEEGEVDELRDLSPELLERIVAQLKARGSKETGRVASAKKAIRPVAEAYLSVSTKAKDEEFSEF